MKRSMTTLTLIKLVLNMGFRFVYPFLPVIGRGLGVELSQMGVLLSVRWGVGLTAPLAVGAIDKAKRSRRLLFVGLIAFGLGSLVTAFSGVFVGAVVGFAFMGIGKPLFDIGSQTYVSERVPYRKRARSLGVLELSWAGGFLIGAPLAGWLIERWGWEMPFWVFGSMAVLSIGAVALLLDPSDGSQVVEGYGSDRPRSAVIPFLAVIMIAGFTLELILVVLGTWLENEFAMTIIALAGVGFLLGLAELTGEGVMVAITDRIGKRNSLAIGLAATAATLVVLSFTNESLAPALVSLFFVTMSLEFAVITGIPIASEFRPSDRSKFLAWFLVASGAGRILADLIGPRIFETSGMGAVSMIAAVSALAGMVLLVSKVEEIDPDR